MINFAWKFSKIRKNAKKNNSKWNEIIGIEKIFKNVNAKEIKNFNGNEIHMRIFEEAILNNSFCLDKAIF